MRGIDNHRQMRNAAHRRDGGEIERVARVLGKSADASFAQHDRVVAFRHNVLGGEQPFVEHRRHATLEQDGEFRTAGASQERKVLHVARADLNHVGMFFDQIHTLFVESLSDDL